MEGLAPGHPQPAPLADGEMLDAVVLAQHRAVLQNDLPLAGGEVGIQKRLHRTMMIRQAEVLAFGFGGGA